MGRKRKIGRPRKSTAAARSKKTKEAKPTSLKNLRESVNPGDMGLFSSLYLDPIEGGFKISIWSGKGGLIEGFVGTEEMAPFVRKILVKRTESLNQGDSIEIIGKREEDIALIAAEPIDAHANGMLVADVSSKGGEMHLKITLQREEIKQAAPEGRSGAEIDIEHLTEMLNLDIRKNTKLSEYEQESLAMLKRMSEGVDRLEKKPNDKKVIEGVYKASESLASHSKKHGFVKITQMADSMSVLFKAYIEKGTADPASVPIIRQTIQMLEKMVMETSNGSDVDSLVHQISRKDT